MPIKPMFNEEHIRIVSKKMLEGYEESLYARIRACALQFIKNARSVNTYKDRTANLRNSIGYVIYKDGVEISSLYPDDALADPAHEEDEYEKKDEINETVEDEEQKKKSGHPPGVGAKFGRALAKEVAEEYAPERGYLLVVTAGMEYAAFVEAGASEGKPNKRPLDVISGSAKLAEDQIKEELKELHDKLR